MLDKSYWGSKFLVNAIFIGLHPPTCQNCGFIKKLARLTHLIIDAQSLFDVLKPK